MIVWSSDCYVVSWTSSILCMGDVVHDVTLDISAVTQSDAEDIHAPRRMYNCCMVVTVPTLTINISQCNKCL